MKIHLDVVGVFFFSSFSKLEIRKKTTNPPSQKTMPSFPTGLEPRKREAENEEDMQSIKMFSDQNGRYLNPNNSFLLEFSLCLKSCSVLKNTQSRREGFKLKWLEPAQCFLLLEISRLQECGERLKNPLNSKGMWGSDGVLVICWYLVIVKDEEIILRTTCSRKSFLIPLSKVPDGTRNPFWGKSPCKQRRFYHLSQIHFLAHCHFQIFPQK